MTTNPITLQGYVSERDRIIKGQKERIKFLNEHNKTLIMRMNNLKGLYHILLNRAWEDV